MTLLRLHYMQDATLKELMRLISNGHWNNLAANEVGIPLRFLQMFGMNLPLWLVTSFVEFELLFLMLLSLSQDPLFAGIQSLVSKDRCCC